ncbi:MAG: hypothetical protein IJP48_09795 [Synergistaceae bacterium]|nr:hypothetical protein [Synergistaceae bacterium]
MTRSEILSMLEIKRHRLYLYHEAEAAILSGQSYEIENLRLTRAELNQVTDMIAKLENEILRLEDKLLTSKNQRSRFKIIIPGGYAKCR